MVSDRDLIAYCLYAEARGEGARGMKLVAGVIVKRSISSGKGPRAEVLRRKQFSCMNGLKTISRPNNKEFSFCQLLASKVLSGRIEPTFTHYYAFKQCKPAWAGQLKNKLIVGNHCFGDLL